MKHLLLLIVTAIFANFTVLSQSKNILGNPEIEIIANENVGLFTSKANGTMVKEYGGIFILQPMYMKAFSTRTWGGGAYNTVRGNKEEIDWDAESAEIKIIKGKDIFITLHKKNGEKQEVHLIIVSVLRKSGEK